MRLAQGFPAEEHDYFVDWHIDGTLTRLHHALYCAVRKGSGKSATPTTSIVDSQSVKAAEKGGPSHDAPGYDGAKKLKGRNVTSLSTRSA